MTTAEHPVHPGTGDRLDGNALAGLLGEVLVGDVTVMTGECGGCGTVEALARSIVELDAAGAIVLCRSCTHTLFTVLTDDGSVRLEIAALRSLRL